VVLYQCLYSVTVSRVDVISTVDEDLTKEDSLISLHRSAIWTGEGEDTLDPITGRRDPTAFKAYCNLKAQARGVTIDPSISRRRLKPEERALLLLWGLNGSLAEHLSQHQEAMAWWRAWGWWGVVEYMRNPHIGLGPNPQEVLLDTVLFQSLGWRVCECEAGHVFIAPPRGPEPKTCAIHRHYAVRRRVAKHRSRKTPKKQGRRGRTTREVSHHAAQRKRRGIYLPP
jgi:hypothetical protein